MSIDIQKYSILKRIQNPLEIAYSNSSVLPLNLKAQT